MSADEKPAENLSDAEAMGKQGSSDLQMTQIENHQQLSESDKDSEGKPYETPRVLKKERKRNQLLLEDDIRGGKKKAAPGPCDTVTNTSLISPRQVHTASSQLIPSNSHFIRIAGL